MNIHIFQGFGQTVGEVAIALLPLIILFAIFQLLFLKLSMRKLLDLAIGILLTFLGLSFFLQGVHIGFLPIGEQIGKSLGAINYTWLLIPIGFVLGFFATYAEPAVRVLIQQVEKASSGYIPEKILLYTVSIGVGLSVALSMIRILAGFTIWIFVLPGYILALVMVKYSSKTFTSIAFDSGGVATGPMTATFILAMFVGIASVTEGRDPLLDGFGMVALVALAPILSVLTLGILYNRKEKELYVHKETETEADRYDR